MSQSRIVAVALAVSAIILQYQALASDQRAELPRPNIVLIVLDDLGYNDLGFQGLRDAQTPNIDKIADRGVQFTQAYVTCPVCSPSRAGLLTGRYQQRFGHEFNPGPEGHAAGLPTTIPILSEVLKPAGYRTIAVGKWHLGSESSKRPNQRGFDEFFGFLAGNHNYYNWASKNGDRNSIRRNDTIVTGSKYLTTAFGDEASTYIDDCLGDSSRSPFFLYLAFNAVHTPMQAPKEKTPERKPNEPKDEYRRRVYLEMLKSADEAIGKVQATIDKHKVSTNTLFLLINDNGGATYANSADNSPLRGYKGTLWEGGIRVPFVVQWDGQLPAGTTYTKPVSSLDIFPTVLAAAGIDGPKNLELDGVNLIPYLSGENSSAPHTQLFWRWGNHNRAIRSGDWKLVTTEGKSEMLFNLVRDPAERKDLSKDQQETVSRLKAEYEEWNSQLVEPAWVRQTSKGDSTAD